MGEGVITIESDCTCTWKYIDGDDWSPWIEWVDLACPIHGNLGPLDDSDG